MDMHLDDLVVVHQHKAVAQLGQERPEILRVTVIFPGNNELGAVGEGDVLAAQPPAPRQRRGAVVHAGDMQFSLQQG